MRGAVLSRLVVPAVRRWHTRDSVPSALAQNMATENAYALLTNIQVRATNIPDRQYTHTLALPAPPLNKTPLTLNSLHRA